jgi:RimJ/RimL family protein N-acetyltransferase
MAGAAVAALPAAVIAGAVLSSRDTSLRPRSEADAAFLRELFHDDRRPQFAGLPEPMLTTLLDQQLRARQIGYSQAFPDAGHAVIAHCGQPAGQVIFASGVDAGLCFLRLIDIALVPGLRGRGIGTDVITGLGRAAHLRGATESRLSVLSANVPARRLYERLGFVACGDDGARIAMVRPLP